MKKLIYGILGIFVGLFGFINFSFGLSFSDFTPDVIYSSDVSLSSTSSVIYIIDSTYSSGIYCILLENVVTSSTFYLGFNSYPQLRFNSSVFSSNPSLLMCFEKGDGNFIINGQGAGSSFHYSIYYLDSLFVSFCSGSSSDSSITVLYNNTNSSTTVACNGDNVIQIDGLSTITATNKFTPYYNIAYTDWNNQELLESFSNSNILLNGKFNKSLSGGDLLFSQINDCSGDTTGDNQQFTGYLPVFDVTGSVAINDTGNVFNNFSDNALKVLLSNIPSYIQYIIIFGILFFIFGFIRKFRKKF